MTMTVDANDYDDDDGGVGVGPQVIKNRMMPMKMEELEAIIEAVGCAGHEGMYCFAAGETVNDDDEDDGDCYHSLKQ